MVRLDKPAALDFIQQIAPSRVSNLPATRNLATKLDAGSSASRVNPECEQNQGVDDKRTTTFTLVYS